MPRGAARRDGTWQVWRYTGQYYDLAAKLYKLGIRYYQPEITPVSPSKTAP